MFQTRDDILKKRQNLKESYTFRHIAGRDVDEKVQPRKVAEMEKVPVLDINSDVKTKIRQIEQTEVLSPPRFDRIEFRKELQASSKRLLKIQNGMPLSVVTREDPHPPYQALSPRRVHIASQREILFPPRGYVAPGITKKSEYVLPNLPGYEESLAERAQNQLVRFKNKIYEAERQKFNETFEVLNRRNKRRPQALMQQYEDYVKHGLKESQRRADRAEQLSILKEKRDESWWPEVVDSFPKEGRSKRDLEILELFAAAPKEFNEKTIGNLYREALERFKDASRVKQILSHINELCNYVKDYRLLMVFKAAERDYAQCHNLPPPVSSSSESSDDQDDNKVEPPPKATFTELPQEDKDDQNTAFPSMFPKATTDSAPEQFPSATGSKNMPRVSITTSTRPLKPLPKKSEPFPSISESNTVKLSTTSTMTDE